MLFWNCILQRVFEDCIYEVKPWGLLPGLLRPALSETGDLWLSRILGLLLCPVMSLLEGLVGFFLKITEISSIKQMPILEATCSVRGAVANSPYCLHVVTNNVLFLVKEM